MSIIKGVIIHFASIITTGFEMLFAEAILCYTFVIHLIQVTCKRLLLEIFASTRERVLSNFCGILTNH